MPPIWASKKVIPDGYSSVNVHLISPNAVHPPQFGFAVNTEDLDDLGGALGVWLADASDGFLTNGLYEPYTLDRFVVRNNNGTFEIPISQPGQYEGADLLTPGVAALVKLITMSAGKRGRGRMYWAGVLGDGDVDNAGRIDNTTLARLQGVFDELLTQLNTATIDMVLLHSYRWPWGEADPGPPVGFPAPTVVTGGQVQAVCATQRRRQR